MNVWADVADVLVNVWADCPGAAAARLGQRARRAGTPWTAGGLEARTTRPTTADPLVGTIATDGLLTATA